MVPQNASTESNDGPLPSPFLAPSAPLHWTQSKPMQNSSLSPNTLQTLCQHAALHLTAHPQSHPFHSLLCQAVKYNIKHHVASLLAQPPHSTHVTPDKDKSITKHNQITSGTRVYTDGSGINGNFIGAAAVVYNSNRDPRYLRYHLGKDNEHTVYGAEAVGLTLVAQLLLREMGLDLPINIFVDNQATIKSGDVFSSKSGHDLINRLIVQFIKNTATESKTSTFAGSWGTKMYQVIPRQTKRQKKPLPAATHENAFFTIYKKTAFHSAYPLCSSNDDAPKRRDGTVPGPPLSDLNIYSIPLQITSS